MIQETKFVNFADYFKNKTKLKTFFYPCAASDWHDVLDAFGDAVNEFHFTDIGYQFLKPSSISHPNWKKFWEVRSSKGQLLAH